MSGSQTWSSRPCNPDDLPAIQTLVSAWRLARPGIRLSVYPTSHRVTLLLTSRVHAAGDAFVWTRGGTAIGFAFLWSRSREDPWRSLEGPFCVPTLAFDERIALESEMVVWAKGRLREISTQAAPGQSQETMLGCVVSSGDVFMQADLVRWGFVREVEHGNVYYRRALRVGDPALIPHLPEAYGVRALAEADVDAYEAIYGFSSVKREARQALLRDPEYAHFVVTSPDGGFVAFCEVSYSAAEWVPGVPHPGWVDYVGTREDARQRGLGSAALLTGLGHLRRQGADSALLVTMPTNEPANALYAATGFTCAGYDDVYVWRPRA